MGNDSRLYDLFHDHLILMARARERLGDVGERCESLDDPKLDELLPESAATELRDEVTMARGLCPDFDLEAYRAGHMTPVFFGSAVNSFGVRELLRGIAG